MEKHNTHDFIFYAGLKIELGYTVNQRIPIYYFSSYFNVIIAYGLKRSIVNVQEPDRVVETGRCGDNIAGNMAKIVEHEEEIKSFKMAQTRVFYLY